MVHCNRCHKQYIGETKRRLKDRFNEHRRPVDKQTNSSKPTTVSEHFLSNDHNASDMLLIPLELIKSVQARKWSRPANDPRTGSDPQIEP